MDMIHIQLELLRFFLLTEGIQFQYLDSNSDLSAMLLPFQLDYPGGLVDWLVFGGEGIATLSDFLFG